MTLDQCLHPSQNARYAAAFNLEWEASVLQAVARAYAANGDARNACAWANGIGSAEKVAAKDDFAAVDAVERRMCALIGLAEGLLEKQAKQKPK